MNACSTKVGDAAGFLLLLQAEEAVADGGNTCNTKVVAAASDAESFLESYYDADDALWSFFGGCRSITSVGTVTSSSARSKLVVASWLRSWMAGEPYTPVASSAVESYT
jgi:hypothetical protein